MTPQADSRSRIAWGIFRRLVPAVLPVLAIGFVGPGAVATRLATGLAVGITFSALFAFLHTLLLLPARALGWRERSVKVA